MKALFFLALVMSFGVFAADPDFSLECGDHYLSVNVDVHYPMSEVSFSGDSASFWTSGEAFTVIHTTSKNGKTFDSYHFELPQGQGTLVFDWTNRDNGTGHLNLGSATTEVNCKVLNAAEYPAN